MDTKTTIISILRATERAGIEDLIVWMENNGFFDAPCSSRYHLAEPGGLAKHSLNVSRVAIGIASELYKKDPQALTFDFVNSLVIASILHDLGKAGQFGKPNYRMKIIEGDPETVAFETNKDLLYIPHEIRSVVIASRFIELTEEEHFAIVYHNGLYGELQSIKNHETPLYMILHFADMWASRVIEKEGENAC